MRRGPGLHTPSWLARPLLVLVLAYTGLHWGEATALRVCDIDLDRRRIDVHRAFSDVGGQLVLGTPQIAPVQQRPGAAVHRRCDRRGGRGQAC